MKKEEIDSYIKSKKEYSKHYTTFKNNCIRVIERFSKIEDDLGKSMINVLYTGDQIYMSESKHWGLVSCDFRFYIFNEDTIVAVNETFNIESMFDIKWLMMTDDEFMEETQKIWDEQKGWINNYDAEGIE